MKTIAHIYQLSLSLMISSTLGHAAATRPAFLPSTPPASKAIAEYTIADVVGILSTVSDQLPTNHPYLVEKPYKSWDRKQWPGAKDPTKIDELIQGILDAASVHLPYTNSRDDWSDMSYTWSNVSIIINEVMDLEDSVKVDALLRILAAQTDVTKRTRMRAFAAARFRWYLDPRLLELYKGMLDDSTAYTEKDEMAEGVPRRSSTIRRDARDELLLALNNDLDMNVDEAPFEIADEAAGCAALKTWLTGNWAQLTAKCAEIKANPTLRPNVPSTVGCFDVRY